VPGKAWVDLYVDAVFQVSPRPVNCITSRMNTATPHNVMNVLMGDGTVRSVSPSVTLDVWRAAITPSGNETVSFD
jgi:hypothetical protein